MPLRQAGARRHGGRAAAAANNPAGETARTWLAGDGIRPGSTPGSGQPRPRAGQWLGWLERVPVPRPGNGGRLARRARVAGLGAVAAGGLAVAVIAAGQARAELDRGPTAAERSAAAATALALRWRAWPAGQIFPARLRYGAPGRQDQSALRVGISPQTGCAAGLDPVAAAAAARQGCQAVLRATYTDRLQGIVWTVGVVAFRGPATRPRSSARWPVTSQPGTRPPQAGAVRHGYLRRAAALRTPVGTLVISGPAGGLRALAIPQSAAGLFSTGRAAGDRLAAGPIRGAGHGRVRGRAASRGRPRAAPVGIPPGRAAGHRRASAAGCPGLRPVPVTHVAVLTRAAARRAVAVAAAVVPALALAPAAAAAPRAWPAPPAAYTVKIGTGQTGDRPGELAGPGSARDRTAGLARLTGTGEAAIWRPSARGASGTGQARAAALAQLGEIGVPAAGGQPGRA